MPRKPKKWNKSRRIRKISEGTDKASKKERALKKQGFKFSGYSKSLRQFRIHRKSYQKTGYNTRLVRERVGKSRKIHYNLFTKKA